MTLFVTFLSAVESVLALLGFAICIYVTVRALTRKENLLWNRR